MILIAYDGSDDSKAAIEQASKMFPGETATILTVWQRFIDTMARVGAGVGVVIDYDEIDKESEAASAEKANEGAAFANESGLQATGKTVVVDTTIADAILTQAAESGASLIVCGSRGYTGLKSLMLGSVSHSILQHADLPVVVVPSPAVAKARSDHRKDLK